jgi:DNA-directed RNA polymerase II subunit RPB2
MTSIASLAQYTEEENKYDKLVWKVIDTYFKANPNFLSKHHIDSYNQFVADGIPRVFRDSNPLILTEQFEETNTYYRAELYLGGKNADRIYYGKPMIYDGTQEERFHYMYPNEARLRNMTYGFSIHYDVDIDIYVSNEKTFSKTPTYTHSLHKIYLGRFPVMVQSKMCLLSDLPRHARYSLGECKNDPGGYFIIDGKEKVVVNQEQFGDNMLYIRDKSADDMYTYSAEVRTVSEDPSKPKRTLAVRVVAGNSKFMGGQIVVLVPNVRSHVPLFILMRALGVLSDKEIIQMCLLDMDKYKMYHDYFIPSVHDAGAIYTQDAALQYISELTKGKDVPTVLDILMNHFMPNVGELNFRMKAFYLGYIVKRLLNVVMGLEAPTDRDNFKFKRAELSGKLLSDLFAEYYGQQMKSLRLKMDMEYYYNKAEYQGEAFIQLFNKTNTIFGERIVEMGLRKGLKGDWGSMKYTKREGISQPMNRLSFYSFISHLRKMNLDIDETAKVVAPRLLHGSQWGIICPAETPDGGSIGFHKHFALSTHITAGTPRGDMIRWLSELEHFHHLEECAYRFLEHTTKVFVNGVWFGNTTNPIHLIRLFKACRRTGFMPIYHSIHWEIANREILIYTDGGRPCRPVLYVRDGLSLNNERHQEYILSDKDPAKKWIRCVQGTINSELNATKIYSMAEIKSILEEKTKKKIADVLNVLEKNAGILEYLDTTETEGSLICMSILDYNKTPQRWTHCEIHPSLIMGVMGNYVIYPENNPAPRDLYGCGQSKQGVSLYHSQYHNRIDKMGVVLNYGQIPLVRTRYMKYIDREEHPYGENAIVAIMCYNGHNTEDAILVNEGALKRGLFRTTYYTSYEAHEESTKFGRNETNVVFQKIGANVNGRKQDYIYDYLDDDGLIKEGTELHDKIVLVGMVTKSTGNTALKDCSETPKKGQLGMVDKAFITQGEEGTRIAKVRVREERIPAMGDKFSSRCGQKGTVGLVIPEKDMPFTASGLRPDIIINPHALPTRMTIGQLIETLLGKVCLVKGAIGDSTAFVNRGDKSAILGEMLLNHGMNKSALEVLYNGQTGEQLEADIFMGPTYYMRLKHMVKDKINYRARGPRTVLTRQTVQGRANDGGGRVGEMERDAIVSHGMSAFLNDSMMNRGDEYYMAVCNQTGSIAIYNETKNIFLSPMADGPLQFKGGIDGNLEVKNVSQFGRNFSVVRVPYAFKLLLHELQTMNIHMRIITEDNVEQLTHLAGKSDQIVMNMEGMTPQELVDKYKSVISSDKHIRELIYQIKSTTQDAVTVITVKPQYEFEDDPEPIERIYIITDKHVAEIEIDNNTYVPPQSQYSVRTKLFNTLFDYQNIDTGNVSKRIRHPVYSVDNENSTNEKYVDAIHKTFLYMYHIIKNGIYVSFRRGQLVKFIPFFNTTYENPFPEDFNWWVEKYGMSEYKNLRDSYIGKLAGFINTKKEEWLPIKQWYVNGSLVGNLDMAGLEEQMGFITPIHNLMVAIQEQNIKEMTEGNSSIADVDFFINRRDYPSLRADLKHPNFLLLQNREEWKSVMDMLPEDKVMNRTQSMIPILSFCSHPDYLDIPMPTPDDITLMNVDFKPITKDEWDAKKKQVVFRGSATGTGVSAVDNQRIDLVEKLTRNKDADVGLTSWAVRDRICSSTGKMDFIRPKTGISELDKYQTTSLSLSPKMNMEKQQEYRYIFYVDGNSAAYRLLGLYLRGFCVIKVESRHKFEMWYDTMFKENIHYLSVKADLSNLDSVMKKIMKDGNQDTLFKIAKQAQQKALQIYKQLPEYMRCVLNSIIINHQNYQKYGSQLEFKDDLGYLDNQSIEMKKSIFRKSNAVLEKPLIRTEVGETEIQTGIKSVIHRGYFPRLKNAASYQLLQYDRDGLTYITPYKVNEELVQHLNANYPKVGGVMDATGGLGTDVIYFAMNFVDNVITTEIDAVRYSCLMNNIAVYNEENEGLMDKIKPYNLNVLEWIKTDELTGDWMAYIDAPWGGSNYNKLMTIDELYVYDEEGNQFGLRELVKLFIEKQVKYIVLKLPHNYNVELLKENFETVEVFNNKTQTKIIHAIISTKLK